MPTPMKYRLRDVPAMLRTAGGRRQVAGGIRFRLWPLLSRLARLHRRTVVRHTRVIAVTGTFGKSTTARAVATAINAPIHAGMAYNAFSSVARAVLRIRPGQRHAVIEVGISGRGQMETYASLIRPDVTVVTSIGSEHHPTLPRLENTREEKAHMVRALAASGLAILNGDDPHVMWMAVIDRPEIAEPSRWATGFAASRTRRPRRNACTRGRPAVSSCPRRTRAMASPCQYSSYAHIVRNVVISGSRCAEVTSRSRR